MGELRMPEIRQKAGRSPRRSRDGAENMPEFRPRGPRADARDENQCHGLAWAPSGLPRRSRAQQAPWQPGSRYGDTTRVAAVVAELAAVDLEHTPPAALVALLAACASAAGRIAARLAIASAEAPAPASAEPERFISVATAADRLGVAPKWLYRRKKSLSFMREMVPGTWRVALAGLEQWMARRGR